MLIGLTALMALVAMVSVGRQRRSPVRVLVDLRKRHKKAE